MSETETKQRGHFTLKAVTEAVTDEGVFEAVISTAGIDREKDIVEPAALVAALKKWNRPIPLAWNHSTEAEDIIGTVEPMTARVKDNHEVVVQGTVDLESKRGAEAWRSFKSGTIGFSYGYLVPDGGATERKGGGLHIIELDVFEVTATPTPMNNDTRVLSVKAIEAGAMAARMRAMAAEMASDDPPAPAEMARRMRAMAAEMADMGKALDTTADLERRITELEGSVGSLEPLAAAADKSVDPLEEASRQAVRGIRLDGIPERKSPRKDPEPLPEPPSEADLREEFRDVTLQLLRGT